MPPKQKWILLYVENEVTKYRWENFCCSAVYAVKSMLFIVCPGDHEMTERRLRCQSPTCEDAARPQKCLVTWKVHHCDKSSTWRIFTSYHSHARGTLPCDVAPKPRVTPQMKEYIQRMDDSSVPSRLFWSNMLRAPDIPVPALGFPSYAQVQRRHNCWLQGSKNSIKRVRELALQEKEPFLIFHLDASFKLSDIGYPVITCGFTDRRRIYHLASVFIVSQRTQREYYEVIGSFLGIFYERMGTNLRIDAVMGDAEAAQLNGLIELIDFQSSSYLMCFFSCTLQCSQTYQTSTRMRSSYRVLWHSRHALHSELRTSCRGMEACIERVASLSTFPSYFDKQWISSSFWLWQIFHSVADMR
ncbi:hypothetical protein AM587_10004321 [Phytophthora nicotianae]|uniref:MULE transposase domain-containing protein n=1 Tax=Phytophthora nicotianae TaxID=4792 RepID=A0A0W8BX05_PHYNI|nr:hypothetical protein AM587_10004321 [Phytophthora nicotianae]